MIPLPAAVPLRGEKMSLSGERKEKDRRRKKIPPQRSDVLFGLRSAFRSQVSAQIKMHLFHQTSSKAACQLSSCYLFTGQRDPALFEEASENRSVPNRWWGAMACMHQETPGVQLVDQKTFFITVGIMFLNFHKMSLIIASNQFPEK